MPQNKLARAYMQQSSIFDKSLLFLLNLVCYIMIGQKCQISRKDLFLVALRLGLECT